MDLSASLPMYDLPEVVEALDSFYQAVLQALGKSGDIAVLPTALSRGEAPEVLWSDSGLFLSQCCGYDLITRCAGTLQPLVTPNYTAAGCRGTNYCSQVVVARDSQIGSIAAAWGGVCVVNEI